MPIYKVLRFSQAGGYSSRGRVESKGERWDSLEAALEELSEEEWEIQMPIYNPVPGSSQQAGAEWLEALLLVNHSLDASQDWERQVAKAKRKQEEAEREYEQAEDKSDKRKWHGEIIRAKQRLEKLQEKGSER
jgi:hypothetical protein